MEERKNRVGARIKIYNEEYVISAVDYKRVCAVNLRTGCRYDDHIAVCDTDNLTDEEMVQIVGKVGWNPPVEINLLGTYVAQVSRGDKTVRLYGYTTPISALREIIKAVDG